VNSGLTPLYIEALIASGTNIFAGTERGVFLSTNNGTTWTAVNNGLPIVSSDENENYYNINSLAASNGGMLFAGTSWSKGLFISTDDGTHWIAINEGLPHLNDPDYFWSVTHLAVDDTYLYAAIGTPGLGSYGIWKRKLSDMPTSVLSSAELPEKFSLEQNYPNPFNPSTSISFSIPTSEFVSLKVFDVLGSEVATLVNEEKPTGSYKIDFNAANLPSGVYLYKLQAGNITETKKLMLLK